MTKATCRRKDSFGAYGSRRTRILDLHGGERIAAVRRAAGAVADGLAIDSKPGRRELTCCGRVF